MQREQLTGMQKREHDLEVKCAKLEREIEFMQKNYDLMLAKAEEEKDIAVQRMVTTLTGQAAEVEAVKDAQAKEARIELLRRHIGRRLLNQGILRGWTAWHETWEEAACKRHVFIEEVHRFLGAVLTRFGNRFGGFFGTEAAGERHGDEEQGQDAHAPCSGFDQ